MIGDEPALLAAINKHPDEDTPRLAYADWLDENGQSTRAEYIRTAIALSVYPPHRPACNHRWGAPKCRGCTWKRGWNRLASRIETLNNTNPTWAQFPCPDCVGVASPDDPNKCPTCGGAHELVSQWVLMPGDIHPVHAGVTISPEHAHIRVMRRHWFRRGFIEDIEATTRDCIALDGTPTPWLRAVVAAVPGLCSIRVVDRVPHGPQDVLVPGHPYANDGFGWFRIKNWMDAYVDYEDLPSLLWECVEPDEALANLHYHIWKAFPTDHDARYALSRAMVQWARKFNAGKFHGSG